VHWQGSLTFQKLLSWRAWRSVRTVQTNVLINEVCILKNKNKLCPYKVLSMFYNSCLNTFESHLVSWMSLQTCAQGNRRPSALPLDVTTVRIPNSNLIKKRKVCSKMKETGAMSTNLQTTLGLHSNAAKCFYVLTPNLVSGTVPAMCSVASRSPISVLALCLCLYPPATWLPVWFLDHYYQPHCIPLHFIHRYGVFHQVQTIWTALSISWYDLLALRALLSWFAANIYLIDTRCLLPVT
jgi:hypothetical protein